MEVCKETNEETGKKRIRDEEKEENETVIVKRRCVNPVSAEAFDFFSQGEISESCGNSWGLCDCAPGTWTVLPVVTDVRVSPSSAVAEMCEMFPRMLIGNLLNRGPFLSPRSVRLIVRRIKER